MNRNKNHPFPGHLRYFPHVDGIRCLAILPVVFYHLHAPSCPGGFLGVDVFFVISGYLICGGILNDLRFNRFSLKSFYYRRIKRIFPAYFALVCGVLLAGVFLYHGSRLLPLAQTALFSAGFSTNMYFWLTMGYFQPTAHENPLLHLWSLGIEEQFYIVVPLAMLVIWKIRHTWLPSLIVVALLLSLAACIAAGSIGHSTSAFYLLPTRAWEMLAGALLCIMRPVLNSKRSGFLAWTGLLLVVVSFYGVGTGSTFGGTGTSVGIILPGPLAGMATPFPGWVTIPAIIGAALLIRHGQFGVIGKTLSMAPVVGIGKISYSLYLWHWPIFVFGEYITYGQAHCSNQVSWLGLSFMCAYASWRWIETPVRTSTGFTVTRAFGSLAVGTGILTAACGLLIGTEGLRNHYRADVNRLADRPYPFMENLEKFAPSKPAFQPMEYPAYDKNHIRLLGDTAAMPGFFLLGDSHAEALMSGLDRAAAENGRAGYYLNRHVDPYVRDGAGPMPVFEWIASIEEVENVYIVDRWLNQYGVLEGLPRLGEKGRIGRVEPAPEIEAAMRSNFERTIEWWRERGKRVFLFTSVPEYLYSPGDIVARSRIVPLTSPIGIASADYRNRQFPVTRMFREYAATQRVTVVPLGESFIRGDEVQFMAEDGRPYYRDGDHLSEEGALHAARSVAPYLWEKKPPSSWPTHRE